MNFIPRSLSLLNNPRKKTPTLTHIPTSWDDRDLGDFTYREKREKKVSRVVKFFFLCLLIFLLVAGFGLYSFLGEKNSFSVQKINFVINYPAGVPGGEEINLPVEISNLNKVALLNTSVVLTYDSGESISGAQNFFSQKIDFGDIPARGSLNRNFRVTLFGKEGSLHSFSAKFSYSLAGSKAVYNKDLGPFTISIKSSPIILEVNSLKEMYVGHDYDFDILVKNNTRSDIRNLIISVRAPRDFIYSSSSLPLYDKNPSWLIKNLEKNSQAKVSLTGKLVGNVGALENFTFYVGTPAKGISPSPNLSQTASFIKNSFDNYNLNLNNVYAKLEKSILLTSQFLDIQLVDDSTFGKNTVELGESISLNFSYKNNLEYPIDNVLIAAKLAGEMVDFGSIYSENGFFDLTQTTLFWDKTTNRDLAQIPAKGTGNFKLKMKVKRVMFGDRKIRLEVRASGERKAETLVPNTQDVSVVKEWVVGRSF